MWKQDIKKKKMETDTQDFWDHIYLNCETKPIYTFSFLQSNHLTKIRKLKQSKHD